MQYERDRLILTDADGVLLNWEYSFHTWMKHKGYELDEEHDKFTYGVEEMYNISKKKKKKLVTEFNNSAAIGFLPPLRDAIQYVTKLHKEHGYVFHCITSLSKNPDAQKLRTMNLEKLFGDTIFERYVYLDTGADKDEVLAEYKDTGYFWIEDKLENAIEGEKNGLDSLIMEHGHNMIRSNIYDMPTAKSIGEAYHIPRFENWKGIYNHITGAT